MVQALSCPSGEVVEGDLGSECYLAFAKDLLSSTKSSFLQGLVVPGKVHAQHHQG